MNRKALLIAFVCGVAGFVLLATYLERFKRQASGGAPVRVVYALRDVGLGERLTRDRVAWRDVPAAYVEDRHVRWSDIERVIGVQVSTVVRANQAVLWSDLATSSDARRDLSSLVSPGQRAVTIRADGTSTFGGLIRPGDRVDVMATTTRTGNETGERVTVLLVQNKLVLAAGRDTGGEVAAARSGSAGAPTTNSAVDISQITLLTSLQEAATLILAQERGRLSLVLRRPDELATTTEMPATTSANIVPQPQGAPRAPAAPTPTVP